MAVLSDRVRGGGGASRLLARCLGIASLLCAVLPGAAWAATWSVSPTGADANSGTSEYPFRTINRAAASARSGDTVLVSPGRYPETVSLSKRHSGVTFRGVGDTPPVIDGAHRRAYGFDNSGAGRLTIENFEITGQTQAGVQTWGARNQVVGNLIHHVGSASRTESAGVRIVRANGTRVAGNTIHHIGPGRASIGIWMLETRDVQVEDNAVYLARKEGVRDWKGLDNAIRRNRILLTWAGIALNTSTGSVVTDNIVHDTVEGVAVKHASYATVLDYWGLDTAHWSRVLHNTVQRSSEASVWIAQSEAPLDYVEVRANRIEGAGGAFLRDIPSLRGPHVAVNANAYSDAGGTPRWLYRAGWAQDEGGLTDWESVRRETGWETDAPPGDAGAGIALPAPVSWTPYVMTPVDSSSKGTWYTRNHLDATADGDQSTYWLTAGNRNEYVVFDFGQPTTFDHLILTLYSDEDRRNPRGYRFSVSDDRASWRSILSGVNQDDSGAARYYQLPAPVTARYLRFTMVDTFCETYLPRLGCAKNFVLSDVTAGLVGPPGPAPEPAPGPAPGPAPEPAPEQGPAIAIGSKAGLTHRGRLRIRVTCAGASAGTARFIVRRAGRRRVELEPACRRSVAIPLRRRLVRRLRRGKVRTVRLKTIAPNGDTFKTRLRVRT